MKFKGISLKVGCLLNLILFIVAIGGIVVYVLHQLDIYTHHGEGVVVPDVTKLSIPDAERILQQSKLRYQIIDSIHKEHYPKGAVYEQEPKGRSKVKVDRIIFLTVTATSPQLIPFPNIDNSSLRQCKNIIKSMGFRIGKIEEVPSEYDGLVLKAICNGKEVKAGDKFPIGSIFTLKVGKAEMLY